jgi:hypothetical protein
VNWQKFAAVSEKFSASIFRDYAIQQNYSAWTLCTRVASSFEISVTFNQSMLLYMLEDFSFQSQFFSVSSPVTASG